MERKSKFEDVSWFLDQNSRGQLNLEPPYQRRSVWTEKDREFFIDTVFKNYPCPAVFLHQVIDDDGRTVYNVVDGKQRLETIIKFAANEIRIPADFGDALLNGKIFRELTTEQKKRFWGYSIAVEQLPDVEQAVVNAVFDRINRNARKLTRQELRHAKFEGWVASFTEKEVESPDWTEIGVVTKGRSKRMNDTQFISELLRVVVKNEIAGFNQNDLDDFYAKYDDPEAVYDFSAEGAEDRFLATKTYLRELLTAEPRLKEFWGSLANIYSIWGTVALNLARIQPPATVAPRYFDFLARVAEAARQLRETGSVPMDTTQPFAAEVSRYASYASGAVTDKTPREGRHDILTTILL
ncbi:DUF262 domain-containing protein [Methylosinus sporium]|uniref:DUF262 domain-containing protein n=1 Tax=Methylosinus sporium TaxID=428 RepID=A0A549T6U1_METSR|nr:DUF262 domain-containing protein [Methylosinus sporium]TRL37592.1 DUF262 domain-containing protein [Methylosinus sporium]